MADTKKGGAYRVGGVLVDANGKPVKGAASTSTTGGGAFDVDTATKPELMAEAERLKLEVKRADGEDGVPLVEDYRTAIKAAQGA